MSQVKIDKDQLKIGHYVCLPIGWTNHPFMFNNFKIKTADELVVLRSLNLTTVEIDPDKSDINIKTVSKQTITQPASKAPIPQDPDELFKTESRSQNRRAQRHYSAQMDAYKNALSKFNSNPDEVFFNISQVVNDTLRWLDDIVKEQPIYLVFADKKSDDLFTHSTNLAVLTLQVAKGLGLDAKDCRLLGLAAMCLDVGLLKVPTQIRRSITALNKAEQSYYEAHTGYSIDILKKAGSFPAEIYDLVANHHERLDGSGYPKGLKEADFNPLCKILQLIDHYVTLTSPPPWQKAVTPQAAIALLYKSSGTKYDKATLEALVIALGIYPPGAIVELNDGQLALVCATNPNDKLKPFVKIFRGQTSIDDQPFENLDTLSLSINKSVPFDKVPCNISAQLSQVRFGYFYTTSE